MAPAHESENHCFQFPKTTLNIAKLRLLKKDYDYLDVIPKPEVPQRLEECKQEEFTTFVIDKMKEKYELSLIR
jgi:hypothetical protein